jgi:hypothetical protein
MFREFSSIPPPTNSLVILKKEAEKNNFIQSNSDSQIDLIHQIEDQCSEVKYTELQSDADSCDSLTRMVDRSRTNNVRDLRERSAVAPASCILLNNVGEGKVSPI